MSEEDADSARKSLLDSAVGKAKEVAGAVFDNDELAREGKLRQAEARANDEADTEDAVARARGEQAVEELGRVQEQARDDRQVIARQAGDAEGAAERDREREHLRAEEIARAQNRAGQAAAGEASSATIERAGADARSEIEDARQEETRAQRERRQAEQLADEEVHAARRERATAAELDPDSGRPDR